MAAEISALPRMNYILKYINRENRYFILQQYFTISLYFLSNKCSLGETLKKFCNFFFYTKLGKKY